MGVGSGRALGFRKSPVLSIHLESRAVAVSESCRFNMWLPAPLGP